MKTIVAALALAVPAAAAAAPPSPPAWLGWSDWTVIDAGSLAFRARVDATWGGLAVLGHAGVRPLDDEAGLAGVIARAGALVDPQRPMRALVRAGDRSARAWLFAIAARGDAPDGCAFASHGGDLALVCGDPALAATLADDFAARGLPALDPRALHGEVGETHADEPRASFDVAEDDRGLRVSATASPPPAPRAVLVSASAFAAARRIAPRPVSVYGLGGRVSFDPRALWPDAGGAATLVFDDVAFSDELASVRAEWREQTRLDHGFSFTAIAPARGFPAGARAFRLRTATTDSGEILGACTPDRGVMGGCRVIGHRPRRTSVYLRTFTLIPADGGTWEAIEIDPAPVRAMFAAPPPPLPPTWQRPAFALGIDAVPAGALAWSVTPTSSGERLDAQSF